MGCSVPAPLRCHCHSLGGLGQLEPLVSLLAMHVTTEGDVLLTKIHISGWGEMGREE